MAPPLASQSPEPCAYQNEVAAWLGFAESSSTWPDGCGMCQAPDQFWMRTVLALSVKVPAVVTTSLPKSLTAINWSVLGVQVLT